MVSGVNKSAGDDARTARFDAGLQLFYQNLSSEISTLREAEFRAGLLALALDAAIIATISQDPVSTKLTGPVRWTITIGSSLVILVLIVYLFRLHGYLTEHRSMRRRIEHHFGLDAPNAIDGGPLLPDSWRRERTVPFSFQAWGVVVPLTLLVLAVQGTALYLVWKL